MIVTRTPVRVSLFGGGSDFPQFYKRHGGAVLSGTINKFVDVIVRDRFLDEIVVDTSEKEIHRSVDEVNHNLIREAMKLVSDDWHGVEVATLADMPGHGTGLGSSGSVTVGCLHALGLYKGEHYGASILRPTEECVT
jgi:D-glycero-alpha-D-manno-heptose-7-phosphate kinase